MEAFPESADLDCDSARELISAAADDELDRAGHVRMSAHIDGCDGCATYAERLAVLTRQVRLRGHTAPAPDFVERVMTRSRPARLGRGGWMRPALAWCGVLIAIQSIGPLIFGEQEGAATHIARHVGASSLALAIGLLYAAWRPHRAFGLVPLVGALLVTTMLGAVLDIVSGTRALTAESAHIAEVVGMVLLWFVAGSPGWDRVTDGWRSISRGAARPTTG